MEQPNLTDCWNSGVHRPEPAPESLDFFLIERYCLYSADGGTLYRARVHHPPWQLREAQLHHLASTMSQAHGLPSLTGGPPAPCPGGAARCMGLGARKGWARIGSHPILTCRENLGDSFSCRVRAARRSPAIPEMTIRSMIIRAIPNHPHRP